MIDHLTDAEWEAAILRAEDKVISYSNIPISKSFTHIEMEGKPFRVRTYECGTKSNPTLVCMLGFSNPTLSYMHLWTALAKRYRVICIEKASFGLNTRLDTCWGSSSKEAAEEWTLEWTEKVFAKLDIPPKVHVIGECGSGQIAALYASAHPERIASYFGITPVGFDPFDSIDSVNRIQFHPDLAKYFGLGKVWADDKMHFLIKRLFSGRHLEGKPYKAVRKYCKNVVLKKLHGLKLSDEYKES